MADEKRRIHFNGTYIEGDIHVQNGDFVVGNKINLEIDVIQWFFPIYTTIDSRPRTSAQKKVRLKAQVQELQNELQKGENANRSFLSERLRNIKKMAPDIWEVMFTSLLNPPSGLALVVQKVARRLAKEAEQNGEKSNG